MAYAEGRVLAEDLNDVEQHLAECATCRRAVARCVRVRNLVEGRVDADFAEATLRRAIAEIERTFGVALSRGSARPLRSGSRLSCRGMFLCTVICAVLVFLLAALWLGCWGRALCGERLFVEVGR